jgi:predicted nucleic acid-binding protein
VRLIDASVLVAAFSRETRTPEAVALLADEPIAAVNLLGLSETRVSLIRKRKRGEMTAAETARALTALQQAVADGLLVLVPQPPAMWDEAVALADRVAVHLRTQDALHAACAHLNGLGLATFDDDLAQAARSEAMDVRP